MNKLFIEMVTTDICNQNCWYCHWKKDNKERSSNTISMKNFERVCDFIEMQERETIGFNFYGGEPTMNPDLIPMIQELDKRFHDKLLNITVLTNLSKEVEYFEPIMDIKSLRLICSLHYNQKNTPLSELLTNKETLEAERHIKKIDKLMNIIEEIRLVVTETNYPFVSMIHKCLKLTEEERSKFIFHIIDQLPLERIKKLMGQFLDDKKIYTHTSTNFKGMLCSAGFKILSNGDVLKCWKDMDHRKLLNIFKDDPKKLPVWEMCRHNSCVCETNFNKLYIPEFLELNNG